MTQFKEHKILNLKNDNINRFVVLFLAVPLYTALALGLNDRWVEYNKNTKKMAVKVLVANDCTKFHANNISYNSAAKTQAGIYIL